MTRRIRLSNGKYTLVSNHRYDELRKYFWSDNGDGYVVRNNGPLINGKHRLIKMHRQILGLKHGDGSHTDHINGNRRDNRDENLRKVTKLENSHNHRKYANNKTGYKGVWWREDNHSYKASIKVLGKSTALGHYDDPKIAAHAYDNAARKYFGEFASTNFKDTMSDEYILGSQRKRNKPRRHKNKRS